MTDAWDDERIGAVVVGVPVRNEVGSVGRCIESIVNASSRLDVPVTIGFACDACDDGTEVVVERVARTCRNMHVICGRWGAAGRARHEAIGLALAHTSPLAPARLWIATTDGDSVVAEDWLTRQLHYAQQGFDAVAGVVELLDDEHRSEHVTALFDRTYLFDSPTTHSHVHGANFGVRASSYLAVGGFPALTCAEDHALWSALGRAQARRVSPTDVRVSTSARLSGRAPGGFADTLAALSER